MTLRYFLFQISMLLRSNGVMKYVFMLEGFSQTLLILKLSKTNTNSFIYDIVWHDLVILLMDIVVNDKKTTWISSSLTV